MSRCHDRPDRSAPSPTASLASLGGGSGSRSSGAAVTTRRPLALRAEDFESLGPPGGPSDLLPRIEAWARGVVDRLHELEVFAIARPASDVNSRQVRFVNDGVAVDGDAAGLVLCIDAIEVRAGLELPASQAREARMRLADPARSLELSAALETLPEQFTLASSGAPSTAEAQRAKADDIRAMLDQIERERGTMWIGWRLPREVALEHAALLDEQLEDALVALAQVFALLAGDGAAGRDDRKDPKEARRPAGRGARSNGGHGEEDRERIAGAARKDHEDRGRVGHARGRGREREPDGESEEIEPPDPVADAPVSRGRGWAAKIPPRPGLRGRSSKGARIAVERGTRVRVLRGPFSGKIGVVHELDGKGSARVMLGLLAVRLEVTNLLPSAEGRARPVLSTSHRKPTPDRS